MLLVKINMCSKYRYPNVFRTEGGPGGPTFDYEGWLQGHGADAVYIQPPASAEDEVQVWARTLKSSLTRHSA